VKLIEDDFSIYSRFGDLNPDELRKLFISFSSLPDYYACAFKEAITSAQDAVSFPFSLADYSDPEDTVPSTASTTSAELIAVNEIEHDELNVTEDQFHS
jgi:hypothetical protein